MYYKQSNIFISSTSDIKLHNAYKIQGHICNLLFNKSYKHHTHPNFKLLAEEDKNSNITYWYPGTKSRSTKERVTRNKNKTNDNVLHALKTHSHMYPDQEWFL